MPKLLVSRIKCSKCGDIICSHHRHDFKYCKCSQVFIDGGTDYLRTGGLAGYINMSIWTNSPFEEIRNTMERYNRKSGEHVKLKDIDNEWLEAITEYYVPPNNIGSMPEEFLVQYINEKLLRNELEYY